MSPALYTDRTAALMLALTLALALLEARLYQLSLDMYSPFSRLLRYQRFRLGVATINILKVITIIIIIVVIATTRTIIATTIFTIAITIIAQSCPSL